MHYCNVIYFKFHYFQLIITWLEGGNSYHFDLIPILRITFLEESSILNFPLNLFISFAEIRRKNEAYYSKLFVNITVQMIIHLTFVLDINSIATTFEILHFPFYNKNIYNDMIPLSRINYSSYSFIKYMNTELIRMTTSTSTTNICYFKFCFFQFDKFRIKLSANEGNYTKIYQR